MATYKIKKKTATNGTTEEILLPISSIDGLQTALDGKQASGSYATTTQVNAKYTKPSNGIPKSDLASAVQTSLGKADTAVQTESDPTVPAWAKASSKPSYTASEVGALPIGGGTITDGGSITLSTYGTRKVVLTGNSISADMSAETGGWAGNFASVKDPAGDTTPMLGWYGNGSGLIHIFMGGAYNDPYMKMTKAGQFTFKNTPKVGTTNVALTSDIPTTTSALTNNSDFATNASVDTKISNLVNSAPEALNTLGELATAIEEHEDAYDALLETVGGKASGTHTHTITPSGSVSSTFTGAVMTSTGSFTPAGSVSKPNVTLTGSLSGKVLTLTAALASTPSFTGTAGNVSVSGTTTGSVSSTFTGTSAQLTSTPK